MVEARASGRAARLGIVACCVLMPWAARAQQNPIVGSWEEKGWRLCTPVQTLPADAMDKPILELLFNGDGTFSVTWLPFEKYKDYWGRYSYHVERSGVLTPDTGPAAGHKAAGAPWARGSIELVIEHGNFVPPEFVGRGTFAVSGNTLTLTDVRLGTRYARQKLAICERTFTGF